MHEIDLPDQILFHPGLGRVQYRDSQSLQDKAGEAKLRLQEKMRGERERHPFRFWNPFKRERGEQGLHITGEDLKESKADRYVPEIDG